MKNYNRYLNVKQFADKANLHRKTIHEYLRDGKIVKSSVEKPDGTIGKYIDTIVYPPQEIFKMSKKFKKNLDF